MTAGHGGCAIGVRLGTNGRHGHLGLPRLGLAGVIRLSYVQTQLRCNEQLIEKRVQALEQPGPFIRGTAKRTISRRSSEVRSHPVKKTRSRTALSLRMTTNAEDVFQS